MYQQISQCRICNNTQLVEVLDLGIQALTGVFPKTRTQAVTAGPLKLVKCTGDEDVCGLLQLQHTYDLGELYGDNYGYRSGLNASMVTHLHAKVRRILQRVTLPDNALIIDIGANDSTTLQAYPAQGCTLVGVDPTGDKFRRFYPSHIQLIPDFFSAATMQRHFGGRKATVITSFSMFYDLEQPLNFMREVAEVLDDQGIWVLEQSYMPTMLRQELLRHRLPRTSRVLRPEADQVDGGQGRLENHRRGVQRHQRRQFLAHGGQAAIAPRRVAASRANPRRGEHARAWTRRGLTRISRSASLRAEPALRTFFDEAKQFGKSICALGASTKGNVLLQYCNITEADIARVGEVNPDKFEAFTPGTLLPIVSEEEVLAMQPDYLLVLPWHFRNFLVEQQKFVGRNLIFPLPQLEFVRSTDPAHPATETQRLDPEVMRQTLWAAHLAPSLMKPVQAACSRVAVFICSSDNRRDVLDRVLPSIAKFWPDRPYPLYVGLNSLNRPLPIGTPLLAPPSQWHHECSLQLAQIAADYVIVVLDDYLIRTPVDQARLAELVEDAVTVESCLPATPAPGPIVARAAHRLAACGIETWHRADSRTPSILLRPADCHLAQAAPARDAAAIAKHLAVRASPPAGVDALCDQGSSADRLSSPCRARPLASRCPLLAGASRPRDRSWQPAGLAQIEIRGIVSRSGALGGHRTRNLLIEPLDVGIDHPMHQLLE